MMLCRTTTTGRGGPLLWSGKRSSVYEHGKGWRLVRQRGGETKSPKQSLPTPLVRGGLVEEDAVADFECAAWAIPHPQKQEKGGEDSHFTFARRRKNVDLLTMGVADGVSGWAEDGVDPALYARELSKHGRDAAWLWDDPFSIMDYAHAHSEALGSSTFTVATIDSGSKTNASTLRWSNVGDSGVKVFRYGSVVAASPVQEHYFNCPRQLANPKKVKECDTPAVADGADFALQKGDVVVLATDGVFDNMFDRDIGVLASKRGRTAREIAEKIAKKASQNARNPKYLSPFAKEAYALETKDTPVGLVNTFFSSMGVDTDKDNPYIGGKLDDITVVVAKI